MGSLFRSEEMRLCQMFLQTEAAYACVSELGELGLVQFKDLNATVNAFQRTFVSEIRRCEEMERKLRYIEKEILKEDWKIPDHNENPKAPAPKEMNDLEVRFEKMDTELRQVNTSNESLKQNQLELMELKEVLEKSQTYFAAYGEDIQHMIDEEIQLQPDEAIIGARTQQQTAALGFFVGTILREKVAVFERVMKFVTHSTVFVRTEEIYRTFQDPSTGDDIHKVMFLVFYQGEQLKNKVKKVCEGLRGTIYPVPDSSSERQEMLAGVKTRITELESVLAQSNDHRMRVLSKAHKEIRAWTIKVEKIKAIYHTLNMFKVRHNSLIAECWFPVKAIDDIRRALNIGEKVSGSSIPSVIQPIATHEAPPTYYNCNKFVKGFQNIVDSYGVATYGEVNPAPYTIITFPFLFAVMFGDSGHGILMFLFGLFMVIREKQIGAKRIANEIASTFFGGRYIIMLMGLFSVYTGFIYNDAFSKSLNIFGTHWVPNYTISTLEGVEHIQLHPGKDHINGTAYLVGVDPIWQLSTNKILFLNSLKMKMAIILGVVHMLFGICLSVFNHIHFREYVDIFVKFIPELLFLGCLFGYLVAIVYYKWIMFDASVSHCAPALLIHYINMFMFKYDNVTGSCNPNAPIYEGQKEVQMAMFFLAIFSVPVLLIVKPVYIFLKRKAAAKHSDVYHHPENPLIEHEVLPSQPQVGAANQRGQQSRNESHGDVEIGQVNPAFQPDKEDGVGNGRSVDPPNQMSELHGDDDSASIKDDHEGGGHGHSEEMSEIVIHQIIETIEFCLGCISHTASYLRLWALSLAHAQLSEVLWSMVLHMGFSMGGAYGGAIFLFIIFFIWCNLTVAILLLMEGLSAFLHTLRLHWVEFQSKFYDGEGYNFLPFSFKYILEMQSLEEITAG